MSKRATRRRSTATTPQEMARTYVDQYFLAHTHDFPSDGIPHDLGATFWDMLWTIKGAIVEADLPARQGLDGYDEAAGLRASYLLGLEVGRRLGGTR